MRYGLVGLIIGFIVASVEGLRFTREPENIVAALSQSLWWHCQAQDDRDISYSWRQGDKDLPVRGGQSIFSNGTLHINNVGNDDVGNYTCFANSAGQTLSSRVAVLELAYINPSFTVSPESQSVFLGDKVILQCQIESLPPASITWTLDGLNVSMDTVTMELSGESTYSIYPVMYHDAGSYKCEGRNPLLNVVVYSDIGELIVEGPPMFTSSLQSVAVPLGLTATFDCRFEGNPEPSVAWFIHRQHDDGSVSSQEVTTSRKYKVYPNGTFEIYDVTNEDVAFYTCRVANTFGEMSDSAHLNTTGNPTIPVFTVKPTDQTVIKGENVTFTCKAESNPPSTVVWIKNGEEIASVDGQLTIINTQPSDAGLYVCEIENGVGYKTVAVMLYVRVEPSFLIKPENLTVSQGSRVTLPCQAAGNPTPTITWTTPNSGVIITSSLPQEDGVASSADGSLVIDIIKRQDHGIYTCTATNVVGTVSASVQITVEASPVFMKLPISYSVQVGERAIFHCQASGYPAPSLFWSKAFEGMITSTARRQIYLNNSLVIHSVTTSDDGVYRCHAYNSRGSTEAPATLTVIVPPSFSVRPTSKKARIGDDVSLDCVAIGDPVPTQKWNKDGGQLLLGENMVLLANFTLMITAIRPDQFGEYVCVASNMAATVSASARIQTEDFPILTIRPSSVTVNMTESATLQCKGEALEAPSTEWFRLTGEGALDVKSDDRVIVTTDGEMIIQNVHSSDEGWYQCVVANSVGNVSENAFINVQVSPKITHTNSPQTTVLYSDVTLTCQSTGDPVPVLHWINPIGQEIVLDSSYQILANTLRIDSVDQDTDGGQWLCRACNLLGCDERPVEIKIEGPPVIHAINGSRTPTYVTLDCFTSGVPEPAVTYTFEGQDVTLTFQGHRIIGSTLYVEETNVMTSYVCVAENRRGQAKEEVSVPYGMKRPTIVTSSSREISLDWSAPDDLGGLPLLGYQMEATPDLGKTWQRRDHIFTSTNGSLSSLMPFTNYQIRIAGMNILGVGIFSDLSETVRTSADAPSPPTNISIQIGDASIVLQWSHSDHLSGDKDDIEYRYKVSIPLQENLEPPLPEARNETESVYQSGTVAANQTLEVIVEGLTDAVIYTVTVWAVNVEINKTSEPVILLADLRVSVSEPAAVSPDTVIAVAFGVVGGIIFILVIVFAVTQIRQKKKKQSMSIVNHRLSLDQFYMEDPKNLYGKKSKFSMKRSGSQGFYKFDNDESFHGAGSVSKENGSAIKEKPDDGGVLLTAKNPLYDADVKDVSSDSFKTDSPKNIEDTVHQSCEQAEIEMPQSELKENFVLKPSVLDGKDVVGPSTGNDVRDTGYYGKDGNMIEAVSETGLEEIYSISKEEPDDNHVYEVPNLVSRNNSGRGNSPGPSVKSGNSKSKPVRVISLDQLRGAPQLTSQQKSYVKIPDSPLDSPTDERVEGPEQKLLKVKCIQETSLGDEDTDLLPHRKSDFTKRDITPPKDIKIGYDLSDNDIKRDIQSATLY